MSTNTTSTATVIRNNIISSSNGGSSRDGPCGACKFLRRKCVEGCVFAPYFDSEQGTAHFAAVHRVFGASNASKLLLRVPADDAQRRLEAVVTLCYEAIARVRDPVYGCVAHIFALQQQVVKLQAELACVQARISTLQQFHSPLLQRCYSPLPSPTVPYNYYTCPQISPFGYQNDSKLIIYEAEEESTSKEMASSIFDDVVQQHLEEVDDGDDDLFNVTP